MPDFNPDAEILRLNGIIRDGIAPRIQGVMPTVIETFARGPVLLLRVPRSWASPHMVTFQNLSRFYLRNSSGKHQMDMSELRSAFAASESIPVRLRQWRDERIGKILANEGPVRLKNQPRLIFHILPLMSLQLDYQIGIPPNVERLALSPTGRSGSCLAYNLDGFITYGGQPGEDGYMEYVQLYRNGRIEAAEVMYPERRDEPKTVTVGYDVKIVRAMPVCLGNLRDMGVPPPVVIMGSVLGARGFIARTQESGSRWSLLPIDRDAFILPEVMINDYSPGYHRELKPIFDCLWNAAGHERSHNFDENGEWHPLYSY